MALRPGLGWTIERTLLYVASRLDLGALLTGTPTLAPGVPDDAVTVPELADAVPAAFGNDPARWEFSSPQFRWQDIPPYEGRNGLDIAQTTALGLRWFGYRDAQADRTSRTPAILASAAFVDIRTCTTATDLGTVQRLTGVASVEGKHAVVISSAGFTRDALRWAAKAGMALFQLSPASGDLRPVSALASAFHDATARAGLAPGRGVLTGPQKPQPCGQETRRRCRWDDVEPTTPVERLIYAHVGREWSEAAEGNAATRPSQPVGFDQWRDEHGDGPVVATTRMPKGLDAADYFGLLIGAPEELTLRTSALPTRPAPAGNGGPAPTSEEPAPPIVRGGDMDLLAWYRPFHQVPLPHWLAGEPEWGIYLTTGGIERLAHEAFVSGGMSPEQALVTAATALYHHELFHGLVEVAATLLEQDPRLTASYPAHAATHATAQEGNCLIAEGMANAFSLRHTDDQSGLASWMRNGPPGYRDFDERMGTRAATRDSVHDLFTHITSTAPADWPILIETTLDLGLEHVGLHEFPLRLIATPGSAYERGDWSWRGAAVLR